MMKGYHEKIAVHVIDDASYTPLNYSVISLSLHTVRHKERIPGVKPACSHINSFGPLLLTDKYKVHIVKEYWTNIPLAV